MSLKQTYACMRLRCCCLSDVLAEITNVKIKPLFQTNKALCCVLNLDLTCLSGCHRVALSGAHSAALTVAQRATAGHHPPILKKNISQKEPTQVNKRTIPYRLDSSSFCYS